MTGATLTQAHQALLAGNLPLATQGVEALLRAQPDFPPAVHLAALIARAAGNLSRAEDLMRHSLNLPGVVGQMRAEFANNLGNLLHTTGHVSQAESAYRVALAAFSLTPARLGLAKVLLTLDRPDEALELFAHLPPGAGGGAATLLYSEALARTGERARALAVLQQQETTLREDPQWALALAARLADMGRHAEAEALLLPRLADRAPAASDPTTHLALAELYVQQRAWEQALAVLQAGTERHPHHVDLLSRASALRWMLGAGTGFADALRRALRERPDDAALRLALATSLDHAGFPEEAEQCLREGVARQPEDATCRGLLAVRCAESGRLGEAQAFIAHALLRAPEQEQVREQAAIVALVALRTEEALTHTRWLLRHRPAGQLAWALHTLALRLTGHADWSALADPAQVCRSGRLTPPAGFGTLEEFNQGLATRLRRLHTLEAHPLVNSVRGGTQVELHPATETDPFIRAFFAMIREPLGDLIRSMPADTTHPLYRRRDSGYRLSGSWTVRLTGGSGRHVAHIHPQGWISSAYYVAVPPEISADAARAGWLSFGRPPYPIPGLEATGYVRPEAGRLALFPSYQWHGVEPFAGQGERLTIAFDVVPAHAP